MIKVQKVYYCEHSHYIDKDGKDYYRADITVNQNETEKLDKNYRLASINEVNEFIGLGYEPIPTIEVKEGVYGWYECEYETILGDIEFFSGYIFLQPNSEWEIKDLSEMISRSQHIIM